MKFFHGRKRTSFVGGGTVILALVGCCALVSGGRPDAFGFGTPTAAEAARRTTPEDGHATLAERIEAISRRAGGDVGVAVIHVETGQTVAYEGAKILPLFSVFKLPLAVAVLKDVEENKLRLDRRIRITPDEAAPGAKANSDLWSRPVEMTVAELLELSLVRSDNTSSDKLLGLVGGPAVVTERMRALGLRNINIQSTVREFVARPDKQNTGTASDLALLLARLQKGEALRPPQRTVLLELMTKATTGLMRLRGDLPAGTPVADKTGTGAGGSVTNDVGIITLPDGKGHLVVAVFVSGSKLSFEAQEKLIAEISRAAYDAHAAPGAQRAP